MDSLVALLVIAVLILLNGLFVAAEFAIVGVPRLAIEHRARAGQRVAQTVRRILDHPREQDRFIATAQLGITFASLGLGMYGERVAATWIADALEPWGATRWIAAHTIATVTSVSLLTYFHIVIGEMVPKSLALQQPERTVLWITPPTLWAKVLLYPLVMGVKSGEAVRFRFDTVSSLDRCVRYRVSYFRSVRQRLFGRFLQRSTIKEPKPNKPHPWRGQRSHCVDLSRSESHS